MGTEIAQMYSHDILCVGHHAPGKLFLGVVILGGNEAGKRAARGKRTHIGKPAPFEQVIPQVNFSGILSRSFRRGRGK